MRFVVAWISAVLLAGCAAAQPAPKSSPSREAATQEMSVRDIGGGASIQIPATWTFNSYYMPPELKATNLRITSHGIKIAITGILDTGPRQSLQQLTEALAKGTATFVPLSKEQVLTPHGEETATTRLVYASFSAADPGKGLPAIPNEHSLMVTSAVISKDNAAFVITISVNASDAEAFENYVASLAALKSVQ